MSTKTGLIISENNHKHKISNTFIQARGKTTLLADKIFDASIQPDYIQRRDDGRIVSVMHGDEIRKELNKYNGSLYDQIKELIDPKDKTKASYMDYRIIYMNEDTNEIAATNVFTSVVFKNGILTSVFSPEIEPYVLAKKHYTLLDAEKNKLKSVYSYKVYKLLIKEMGLLKYRGEKPPYVLEYDIVDFKLTMGIIDPKENREIVEALEKHEKLYKYDEKIKGNVKFKTVKDLRKNVLDRAVNEITEKTSIKAEYELLRAGRGGKTHGVRFVFSPKEMAAKEITEDEIDVLIDEVRDIIEEKISTKDIKSILKASDYNLDKIKDVYTLSKYSGEINNLTGWLIKAMQEGYKNNKTKNQFNEFEQNKIENWEEYENLIVDN